MAEIQETPAVPARKIELLTVPNVLCAIRLVGSFSLVALAIYRLPLWMIAVLAVMVLTDLIDGRVARYLKQQTQFGALLDSVADATMYGSALIAAVVFAPETFRDYIIWIVVALVSYVANILACAVRFRHFPSYHTKLAKWSWILVVITFTSVVLNWANWPIAVTAVAVTIANLEGILITYLLPKYRTDVPYVWQATKSPKR